MTVERNVINMDCNGDYTICSSTWTHFVIKYICIEWEID